jgi:hypothetical protein
MTGEKLRPALSIASASCCVSAKMRPREKTPEKPCFLRNGREHQPKDWRGLQTTVGNAGRN